MTHREDILGSYDPRGYRRWLFADRAQAGRRLAQQLSEYHAEPPLVLAIRCGGVPIALAVARKLAAELDVKATCNLTMPGRPELALGAVTGDGAIWLNRELIMQLGLSNSWIEQNARARIDEARRLEQRLWSGPALDVEGRTVLLVDDGLATGARMRVAASCLAQRTKRVIIAVPLASQPSLDLVAEVADRLICLERPDPLLAVGLHYRTFETYGPEQAERSLRLFRQERLVARRAH